jgi:hypothetical protein
MYMKELLVICLYLLITSFPSYANGEVTLADFEYEIPCSEQGDPLGFRKKDVMRAKIVPGGTEDTKKSALINLAPSGRKFKGQKDLFFQGSVRRMYLATKSTNYNEYGPNALSFWMKVNPDSVLVTNDEKNTIGVWTYHWRPGDTYVGGKTNQELATDSMMHGYSNFYFTEKDAGKWIHILLTSSAFQQSRYYYHFYAARGTTDDLRFFPSLRQLQFHFFPKVMKREGIQIDQLKLIYLKPNVVFERDFVTESVSGKSGDVAVPVTLKNQTERDRKYRVFISSFLGVHRDVLYNAHVKTDSFAPPRKMQKLARGDGGLGVVELIDKSGNSMIKLQREIFIPAGGVWQGKLIHHIKPEMLGPVKVMKFKKDTFTFRRDTLTTSVIVWDPYDDRIGSMNKINILPSNADDGNHPSPPGFPRQKRPPEGWRSEDIPTDQVGGYFVSVIQLTE